MESDQMLKDILARLDAQPKPVIDQDELRRSVTAIVNDLFSQPEFARKMKFAAEPRLFGTKYARWGLSLGDIEFLYDLLEAGKARGMGSGASEELRNVFGEFSKAVYLPEEEVKRIDRNAIDNLFPRVTKANAAEYERLMRAMDTAESGYGSQLIGAQYVGELWQQAREASRVFGLLDSFEMTAPVAYLPVEVDFPELLFVSESTANNSANYTTVKTGSNRVTVTAYKFVMHQMWSGEMEEDAIVAFVPFLRAQAAKSLGYYSDSLVLNGDTTNAGTGNINLDDADPADSKHYLAFDGIRHACIVDNTNNVTNAAGAIALSYLRTSKGHMVDSTYKADWGHPINPADLIYAADPETADAVATLDEVVKAKQYANAPLFNGETGRFLGHPVISSIAVSKTEADGKVSTTGSNNIKGQIVTFNRNAFKVGWRRRVKIETDRMPQTDQNRIVYSMRMGFGRFSPTGAASGIEGADVIYNITL